MASTAIRRMKNDVSELENPEAFIDWGVRVQVAYHKSFDLIGEIAGPAGTPYEGGRFRLEIKLSYGYPFQPPQVRFLTKTWHPNVGSETGEVCFDWSPAMTIRPLLLNFRALLADPLPDEPRDVVVARQYKELFRDTARFWTQEYASGKPVPI